MQSSNKKIFNPTTTTIQFRFTLSRRLWILKMLRKHSSVKFSMFIPVSKLHLLKKPYLALLFIYEVAICAKPQMQPQLTILLLK